jgi:hypothetical protein
MTAIDIQPVELKTQAPVRIRVWVDRIDPRSGCPYVGRRINTDGSETPMAWDRVGKAGNDHPMFDINIETRAFKQLHEMVRSL